MALIGNNQTSPDDSLKKVVEGKPGTSAVRLNQLRYFVAAVDYGSFRKAAAALSVQESSISRRIRARNSFFITHWSNAKLHRSQILRNSFVVHNSDALIRPKSKLMNKTDHLFPVPSFAEDQ